MIRRHTRGNDTQLLYLINTAEARLRACCNYPGGLAR
jgi:hypothetical protein